MCPLDAFVSLLPRGFDNPGRQECLEQEDHDRDHERSACKLGQSELPAHEQGQQDTEFDNEIGGSELKGHCSREVRSFAEHGACERDGGVGTGRRCCPQAARHSYSASRVVGQQSAHLLFGYDSLDDCREAETENQCPKNLPGHCERHHQSVTDCFQHTNASSRLSTIWVL